MNAKLARRVELSRRRFLAHAAKVSGASLATIPLVGCGPDDEDDANSSTDAGTDVGSDVQTDTAGDTGTTDVATDPGTDTTAENPIFRFAIVADTHIIDEWYEGPESNPLDTESIFRTLERYTAARDFLMSLDPAPEFICHVGDFIHDYVNADIDFMFENRTRLDIAVDATNGFGVPFHMCLGNHDYEFRDVERSLTHDLFREKGLLEARSIRSSIATTLLHRGDVYRGSDSR